MNGTRIRAAVALACVAALAAPGSSPAATKTKRAKSGKTKVTKVQKRVTAQAPQGTILLNRLYDAGGNGEGHLVPQPGVRVDLGIDIAAIHAALGNEILGQLGLPLLQPGQPVQLPSLPLY